MHRRAFNWLCAVGLTAGLPVAGLAQAPPLGSGGAPVLTGVFPPGGRVGETTSWTLRGLGLTGIERLIIGGEGVEVTGFTSRKDTTAEVVVKIASNARPGYREIQVEGPHGVSNLGIVRLDVLPQVLEVEPNNDPNEAAPATAGTVVIGVLKATDVDHFKVKAAPGQILTLDLEARRIGTPVSPVMTVHSQDEGSIIRRRDNRSGDHDTRLSVVTPRSGSFLVEIRDNTYSGSDQAAYRLRIDPAPFASAVFPLGGPSGRAFPLTLSGGSLDAPISKTFTFPMTPGTTLDPGSFESPLGLIPSPQSIEIGAGDERFESPPDAEGVSRTELPAGSTVNGRISKPGETDVYILKGKQGDSFQVKVRAAALGSWLDSVITVVDSKGVRGSEYDDTGRGPRGRGRAANPFGLPMGTSDSQAEIRIPAGGEARIEISDRHGDGGPEYGYRVSAESTRPDLSINLLLSAVVVNGRTVNLANFRRGGSLPAGAFGVFNLPRGATVPVNFIVSPLGRPGDVEVVAEGLPEGIEANPVKLRFPGPKTAGRGAADPAGGVITLKVAKFAAPALGTLRISAAAKPEPGVVIKRYATATVALDSAPTGVSEIPITRTLSSFPIRILGEIRPQFVGPPLAPRLRSVTVPGILYQGDQLDLSLDFDRSPASEPGFHLRAKGSAPGFSASAIISSESSDESEEPRVFVRAAAEPNLKPGVYVVTTTYGMSAAETFSIASTVVVRPPIQLFVPPLAPRGDVKPGDRFSVWAIVRREPGFDGVVDLRATNLPEGMTQARPASAPTDNSLVEVPIRVGPEWRSGKIPLGLRIIAIARMPRGVVSFESGIGAMPANRSADN